MKSLVYVFLFSCYFGVSQTEDAWVYFKDKPSEASFLNNPILMLSQRSIDRRVKQGIAIDSKDVPVESSYINQITAASGIVVKAKSKWLNALHIQGTESDIQALLSLNIVSLVEFCDTSLNKAQFKKRNKFLIEKTVENTSIDYGVTQNQVEMLQGDFLHELGYTGKGLQIAVLDAGFKGVESFAAFSKLHDNNMDNGEILGGFDYLNRTNNFYVNTGSTHGLSVLSTIAGFLENQFVGTAPDAQFYLFVTENPSSESTLEESLWVEAAEKADSLGVDIINTSLGYTTFDDSSYNYTYADMNGATTFISRGASVAGSKGMLLVTSAGNEGNSSWKFISAPADVASVLTVGAVDANEIIASFSSFGPTADMRVKPEVLAQGRNVYVINSLGNIALSNGTSFSSPIMAGMSACLWEAFPNKTAEQIKQLIVSSGDLFQNPTDQKGYGVPDFQSVYNSLSVSNTSSKKNKLFPNPVDSQFIISTETPVVYDSILIRNVLGKTIKVIVNHPSDQTIDISELTPNIYFVEFKLYGEKRLVKIVKK
ncbi:S8 family serine peptidase [Flavicella marina]|uniref:S8 family serine peptidase n=1 Tax=Flavicella marina TaxID=1475951 RepID=UPI0012642F3B|nr:S8 family serine peptidase [Flavicella marina]